MRSFIPILLFAWARGAAFAAKPPTVDPTYGGRAPRAVATIKQDSRPTAKWIWAARTADNQTIYVRATVTLKRAPKRAIAYATCDNQFELFVNGRSVGATPVSTDPVVWRRVQRYDVTDKMIAGVNVIAFRAHNIDGAAGLVARLDADGKPLLVSDSAWRALDTPDPPADWLAAKFDDSIWRAATIVSAVGEGVWGGSLVDWPDANSGAPYLAHVSIKPKSITLVSGTAPNVEAKTLTGVVRVPGGTPTTLLVDFGIEIAGRVQIWGTAGAPVTVATGESREECDHAEPELDNHGPFNLTLDGASPASTPYTAFRYAKLIFTGTRPVVLTRVACDHKYYPVQYRGSFACSNPLLTKIWYAGAYTAHLCMQEDIWDAPKRDRGLWIGDLQVTGQTINTVFADKFLMERSIENVRDQAQGGRPPNELPTSDVNSLPGYSAAWFCALADLYRHNGDLAFLKRQQAKIVSLLEFQQGGFDSNALFTNPRNEWNFCDWAADFVDKSKLALATTDMYIIHGAREAIYLLRELHAATDADRFTAWADRLTAAARARLASPQTNTYGDRIQENVMAILSGVATPEQRAAIYDRVLQAGSPAWKIRPSGNIDECEAISPYYGCFLLQALGELGRRREAQALIVRYWGDMLRRGAVTFWEKFDPSWPEDFGVRQR